MFALFYQRQRFRDTISGIEDTLLAMALAPRLMPGVAAELRNAESLRSSASTPSLRSREGMLTPERAGGKGKGGNVKVVVRVRGFLPREIERGAECLVHMDSITQATKLLVPNDTDPANLRMKSRKIMEEKMFTFDNSFWSHDIHDEHYAHQEEVYNCLGEEFLDHNFEGYHTCIFAYGQTGSGKSYTMMGTPSQPGLIPRTCEDLFQRIEANETPNISYNVRVSYFEVYNEHVRDLLVTRQDPPHYLKIRESPTEGPYIKDLTDAPVKSIQEIMRYMNLGDSNRTIASTKMNDTSSRSHAVFTIMLKQIHHDMDTDETTERLARIRLVDLAGSERAKATEATGARLREGSNINKSLTTLGRVIAALADPKSHAAHIRTLSRPSTPQHHRAGTPQLSPQKSLPRLVYNNVVPYRDSILTWLLKDSLGGNSKTAMIACISPADYDETLSTLRYADQAKRIRTRAKVNQDHVSAAERERQIQDMAEQIRQLELQLSLAEENKSKGVKPTQGGYGTGGGISGTEQLSKAMSEQLEEYQGQVGKLQRLMEERGMVAEGKIRALQTENEALRLHLKLAVESLKNPIPAVTNALPCHLQLTASEPAHDFSAPGDLHKTSDTIHTTRSPTHDLGKENFDPNDIFDDSGFTDSGFTDGNATDDDDDGFADEDWKEHELEASEMQAQMRELLRDLGMFRRKIEDDKGRWGEVVGCGFGDGGGDGMDWGMNGGGKDVGRKDVGADGMRRSGYGVRSGGLAVLGERINS